MHETSYLPAHHVGVVDGIPTTSPARTIFDLCGLVHPDRADRVLEHALHQKLVTYERMEITLAECARQGRSGSTVLRQLLATRGEGYVPTESVLEAMVLAVLTSAGLPLPRRQVLLGDDQPIGRVDFFYPEARLVIEADGRQHGGWLAMQEDERRDARLGALGYRVIRVRWRMLTREPELFVANIRAALRPVNAIFA
jgi:very-short-patch-repair endonuclease